MSIQAEKFQLIEWLIRLEDTTVLEQLKALKEKSQQFAPLTSEKLRNRALASERDIATGDVIPLKEMMKENWQFKNSCLKSFSRSCATEIT